MREAQGRLRRKSPGPDRKPESRVRALIVDDERENLDLLEEVLAESGFFPLRASNGMEAMKILSEGEVHIIIADAMMPRMDGFQLCKAVRSHPGFAAIPFVLYSGAYIDEADQEFARKIGADLYVMKSDGPDQLTDAVTGLVQQRYGRKPGALPQGRTERMGDQAFLEQHHSLVIKKLEEKMAELELNARRLEAKTREIQLSEDRYRGLFEHVSLAIFVVDRSTGRVMDVNTRGLSLLRITREELLRLPQFPFHDGESLAESFRQAEGTFTAETMVKTGDGDVLEVEVGGGPMTQREDERVLLFVRDITEQRRMRAQLLQAEKMGLLGRVAAGIAHEIRNPLSAVSLQLQYLLQKFGSNADIRQSAQEALDGTQRIAAVVENTLTLARVSPPVLRPEDVNTIIETVLGFLRISSQQKKIRVEQQLTQGLPRIMADATQVQQVVVNVVQNAIDASPEGGSVVVGTRTSVRGSVEIVIRDHGPGISSAQRKRLFEQFNTTKADGTGLGLTISKQIMDRHHGEIHIDEAPGGGTAVTIAFPPPSV